MTVYAVGPEGGPYKIGTTKNMRTRLPTLQTASPIELELVAEILGGYGVEAELHDKFRSKRVRGEWFALDEEDIAYIRGFSQKEPAINGYPSLPTVILYPNPSSPGFVQLGAWCVSCDYFHYHGDRPEPEANGTWGHRSAHCCDDAEGNRGVLHETGYYLRKVNDKDLPRRAQKRLPEARQR